MNLIKHIKELAACKPTDAPFISLYLNTRGTESRRRQYDIFLKEKLRFFQKEFSGSGESERSFQISWEQIKQYLDQKLELKSNGVALFSRWQPEENFFLTLQFPVPLENRFVVDSVPHIFPLVQFLDNSHHFMLMISDSEKAKIFEVQFGGIKDIQKIHKPEDEKIFRGEWSQIHYQNWKKNQTEQLIKKKIGILAKLMESKGINHLILAGDEVMLARIKQELPKWLLERVVDCARMDARMDDHQILRQSLRTFFEFERAEDLDAIASLHREIATDGLGVLGTLDTVEALNFEKIDQLIVATEYEAPPGWRCRTCGFLGIGRDRHSCHHCGQYPLNEIDTKEEMIRKTLLSGASVETIVHNEWLMKHGGVGALLRYK